LPGIEDFYRKRLLYRLTAGGEAAEAGLRVFAATLTRRAELQSVALEDIRARLMALAELAREAPDAAKIHAALRDLVHVFEGLAANAEAIMASLARSIDLQRADAAVVMSFKSRLIDYLQRFIGDLVTRSSQIAELLESLMSQLAAAGARLRYHGDFDWPGLTIGNFVVRALGARPWRFTADDYLAACQGGASVLAADGRIEAQWDPSLAGVMAERALTIHEEAVSDLLLEDLRAETHDTR